MAQSIALDLSWTWICQKEKEAKIMALDLSKKDAKPENVAMDLSKKDMSKEEAQIMALDQSKKESKNYGFGSG